MFCKHGNVVILVIQEGERLLHPFISCYNVRSFVGIDVYRSLTSTFRSNIINNYGETGREWLNNLEYVVRELAAKWNLTNLKAFPNLTFNYVASALRGEVPVVLKAGIEQDLLKREAAVLTYFKNYGAVDLIDSCDGALLLKRCRPGDSLMNFFPHDE